MRTEQYPPHHVYDRVQMQCARSPNEVAARGHVAALWGGTGGWLIAEPVARTHARRRFMCTTTFRKTRLGQARELVRRELRKELRAQRTNTHEAHEHAINNI